MAIGAAVVDAKTHLWRSNFCQHAADITAKEQGVKYKEANTKSCISSSISFIFFARARASGFSRRPLVKRINVAGKFGLFFKFFRQNSTTAGELQHE